MRYCSNCGSEYLDDATECSDCPGAKLVSAQELKRLGVVPITEIDTRRFVRVAQIEDPLTAQLLTRLLENANIPVLTRDPRGGTVDSLTTGISQDWWELSVPRRNVQEAKRLLSLERQVLRDERADAEEAAEREALESAPPSPS